MVLALMFMLELEKSVYETQIHYRNLNAILQQEKTKEQNILYVTVEDKEERMPNIKDKIIIFNFL